VTASLTLRAADDTTRGGRGRATAIDRMQHGDIFTE
jgi:hypothetical protein